jgi:hypothetical protein
MYVAGTRSIGEAARDWWKIPAGKTTEIERYGQLTEALKNNPQVDTIIGHSRGASALAELQKQTDNKYMARYYGAPFWNINPFDAPDPRNQTFRHPGDPISAFDHNAVDITPNNFDTWWWSHGYSGYPDDKILKSYRNDFSSFDDTDNSKPAKKHTFYLDPNRIINNSSFDDTDNSKPPMKDNFYLDPNRVIEN